jgi:dCMP deaminase
MSRDQIRSLLSKEANYDVDAEKMTPKRNKYLSWDDYFMAIAFLSAKRSKDPATPTGACIVDEQSRVIGIGYNGFPRGCSDDALPWAPKAAKWLHTPNPYMCHAEVNAILNRCSDSVADARMFVPHFPCKSSLSQVPYGGKKRVSKE